jgi:hypothetical protein
MATSALTPSYAQREAGLSTEYNSKYSIANFIPFIEIQDQFGNVEVVPDYLNWSLTSLLATLTDWIPVTYDGSLPLVTLVARMYNTTTLIWLVLIYNGFMNALEITPGTTIKMPRIDLIDAYLQSLNDNSGNVVLV